MTAPGIKLSRSGIQVCRDSADLARAAAGFFCDLARVYGESHARFTVALSGGKTPQEAYELLGSSDFNKKVPWNNTHLFWGDERAVPSDDPESNYRMVWEALLSKVELPARNIHPVKTEEAGPKTVSAQYDRHLREFFRLAPHEWPAFDLMFLGLGQDGHTASLFPGSAALEETERLFVANEAPKLRAQRYTMTFPVLDHARQIVFLVSGAEKAPILKEILEGREAFQHYPAARVSPVNGELWWLVDEAAASRLSPSMLAKVQRSPRS